jgi:4-hydroxybenzoate polyprenyltransferase
LLYSVPAIPTRQGLIPLRNIPLLKLFLIAYVWASVTVWLPLLAAGWPIMAPEGWLLFLQRFLFILPLTIVFDIRDIERDKTTATLTLPRLLGVRRAKIIAFGVLLLYMLLVALTQEGENRLALLFCGVMYGILIGLTDENRSEYFYAIAGDSILILPFIVLWFA